MLRLTVLAVLLAAACAVCVRAASADKRRPLLYIVYDDLRPDIGAYGEPHMSTPNLDKLASSSLLFGNAYCQQAVCSPSRMSFTTGRRPTSTKAWNFLNHIRQATCSQDNRVAIEGTAMSGGWTSSDPQQSGGAGQCCTSCTGTNGCVAWGYVQRTCTLYSHVEAKKDCNVSEQVPCVSGVPGSFQQWTPLPENLRKNGYRVYGVGKYFHDGNGGFGDPSDLVQRPRGNGLPPMADAGFSWTNDSTQYPDLAPYYAKYGKFPNSYGETKVYLDAQDEFCHASYCAPANATEDGAGAEPPFCDYITYNDALHKMEVAVTNYKATGQPFALFVGIRRPHLNWRVPPYFPTLYDNASIPVPVHTTLYKSIDPVAWTTFNSLGGKSPYEGQSADVIRNYRHWYYSAVSWGDHVAGKVLDALASYGLDTEALTIMHSGWHLGHQNLWEKRTNFQNAARVPLMIRAPWMPQSQGKRTEAIVELVDVYQTVCDLLDVPLPTGEAYAFEGTSLRPVLENPEDDDFKDVALSMFPRCPTPAQPVWAGDNSCIHNVERTDFTYMGYAMFVKHSDGCYYRYVEWMHWNGTTMQGNPDQVRAVELYNHTGDMGVEHDKFEVVNLATTARPEPLLSALAARLRLAFNFPAAE